MGIFSNSCDRCGSTEHTFQDCPHSFFSKACDRCGSTEHTFRDCPHTSFSRSCDRCGSTEHTFQDCPHSFFSKACDKCGSANHATQDCPQGFFAKPGRHQDRPTEDNDELADGLLKLAFGFAVVALVVWLIFKVILPILLLNLSIIFLISSLKFSENKHILQPISAIAAGFCVFDYNYGILTSVLRDSFGGPLDFLKYVVVANFAAGLVALYLIGEGLIRKRVDETGDPEAYGRQRSILIGSLAFVGLSGLGIQYLVDRNGNADAFAPDAEALPSSSLDPSGAAPGMAAAIAPSAAPSPAPQAAGAPVQAGGQAEGLTAAGGTLVPDAAGSRQLAFVGYAQKDSCYGTVYRKSGCGSMDNLSFGGWGDYYYVYLHFDVESLPDITNGDRAEIWLWGSAPNDPGLVVERVTESWSEAGISLADNPASVPIASAPPVPVNPNWIKVDITNLYKSWKSGAVRNLGIKLTPRRNDETNGSIASSENADDAIRPRLVVTRLH